MATMPYFGEQPGVGANFPSTQHIIFETEFRRRLRDLSVIDKITSKTWKGRFRNAGAQIRIPCLPLVQTNKRKPGDPVAYQDLKGSEEVFTINRERDVAFHVEVEDNIFSPMNLESAVNKEARAQLAEDRDMEFFKDIYAKCHEKNQGNTAGVRYGAYDVGSSLQPVYLYKTDGEAATAGGAAAHKFSATEFVTNLVAMIEEWPGGSQGELTVLMPTCVQNRLLNSELKYADRMGDQMSVLRKGVKYLGDIAGAHIIGCNQLPYWAASGSLPNRFMCMVINSQAVEYVDEVIIDENIKDKDKYGNFYRTLAIYDWFARYPELFGYGVCALG